MSDYKLLPCPFCGCEMSTNDAYPIAGEHSETCYFRFVDNQNEYDFTNPKHLEKLHRSWNTRAQLSRQKGE